MRQTLRVSDIELKECVTRAVGRVLKEEMNKGEILNEGVMDKIKAAVQKYGIPAALGIAALTLHQYGMSDAEVEEIEADMRENPDKYFGATYDNGGLDYDEEHAGLEDDDLYDLQDTETGLIKNPNYGKGKYAP